MDIFTLIYPFSSLTPSLWETTRYRLKYCLKGSLSPKTTNLLTWISEGQWPIVLTVGAGWGCLAFLSLIYQFSFLSPSLWEGWSGGAMVLGKLPVPGRPTIWITVGQGLTALAVGAGGGCLDIFTLIYPFFPLSPSLWETARYRLKYCLKGPLNPNPTNQPTLSLGDGPI